MPQESGARGSSGLRTISGRRAPSSRRQVDAHASGRRPAAHHRGAPPPPEGLLCRHPSAGHPGPTQCPVTAQSSLAIGPCPPTLQGQAWRETQGPPGNGVPEHLSARSQRPCKWHTALSPHTSCDSNTLLFTLIPDGGRLSNSHSLPWTCLAGLSPSWACGHMQGQTGLVCLRGAHRPLREGQWVGSRGAFNSGSAFRL